VLQNQFHVLRLEDLLIVEVVDLKYDEEATLKAATQKSKHVLKPLVVVDQRIAVHVNQLHQPLPYYFAEAEVRLDCLLPHVADAFNLVKRVVNIAEVRDHKVPDKDNVNLCIAIDLNDLQLLLFVGIQPEQ